MATSCTGSISPGRPRRAGQARRFAGKATRVLAGLLRLAALVLAAAGAPWIALAGDAADDLAARPLSSQLGILGLEIRSAGHRCPDAVRLYYSGFRSGADLYTVRCSDNRDYLVQMRIRDGQLFGFVNSCGTARANYGLRCWRPLP